MSSRSVQNKIWKAFGKVGRKLGTEHEIYRSHTINDPIDNANYLDTKKVSFSLDDKYRKTPSHGLEEWKTWVDGRLENKFDIQRGDWIVNSNDGTTYYVANVEPHSYIISVRCDNIVTFYEASYSNPGTGYTTVKEVVASNVPVNIEIDGPKGNDLGYADAQSYAIDPIMTAKVYTWDPKREIKIGYTMVDEQNVSWRVYAIEKGSLGTTIHVEMVVGTS